MSPYSSMFEKEKGLFFLELLHFFRIHLGANEEQAKRVINNAKGQNGTRYTGREHKSL